MDSGWLYTYIILQIVQSRTRIRVTRCGDFSQYIVHRHFVIMVMCDILSIIPGYAADKCPTIDIYYA